MEPAASSMFSALRKEVKDLKTLIEELTDRVERIERPIFQIPVKFEVIPPYDCEFGGPDCDC